MSFCFLLWYLGMGVHTTEIPDTLVVLAWCGDMARGRRCNSNWKVQSFFVFKESQEVRRCIVFSLFFFFLNEARSAGGVVLRSRRHLLTCDWLPAEWSRRGQPVTSIVTSRSPAPRKHSNKCINDARQLNPPRKTSFNWTHQRNYELSSRNIGRYRMSHYLYCAAVQLPPGFAGRRQRY